MNCDKGRQLPKRLCAPREASGPRQARRRRLANLGLAVLLGTALSAQAEPGALAEAESLLARGQGQAAYQRLLPLEPELAGDAAFDLLFGRAAVISGEGSRAAMAFERCLALTPLHGACRLGMVQAHMLLSEAQGARREIAIISQSKPPAEVQRVLDDYLSRLAGLDTGNQDTRLTSYIELGAGYDSNFNNATALDSMALPLFNNQVFRLSRDGQARGSGFNQAHFNLRYSTPVSEHWRLQVETNLSANLYWETHRYNSQVADLTVGMTRRQGSHQVALKLQGQHYRLGSHTYRNLMGVLGQYAYTVNEQIEVNTFLQATRLSYPGDALRNAQRYAGGASVSHVLAGGRALAYLSAYGGRESTRHRLAPEEYGYRFGGARIGGLWLYSPRTQIEASIGAERRRYDGREPLFLKARRDTVYDLSVGLSHALTRKLSLRPQYRYVRSASNIDLRDYQRHLVTVNLRYELF